jgi:hypothetical protein
MDNRSDPFAAMPLHTWNWGKVYMPNHTLFFWTALLGQEFGYAPRQWIWVLEGEKLIEYKNDARLYIEPRTMS